MDNLIFKRCDTSFRFSGDASGHARWMVELPVRIADHPGRIQAYIIYGATPMLFSRPLLEARQAEVNFGESKMRLLHQDWQDTPRGRQGAMLLRLVAKVNDPQAFESPVFDFREDDQTEQTNLNKFLDDLNAHESYFETTTEVKTFFATEDQLQEAEKHVQQEILHARDQGQHCRRKLIWEVYAGEGKITSLLQAHGDVE